RTFCKVYTMGLKLQRLLQLFAALALMAIISTSPATIAAAQFVFDTPDVANLLIQDDTSPPIIDPQLAGATGPVQLVVHLTAAPLAVADGVNAKQLRSSLSPAKQTTS